MKLLIMIYRLATYLYLLSENAIEDQHNIELVDVEQMYGPKTKKTFIIASRFSGLCTKVFDKWSMAKEADRFAGAILLGEILSWCSEEVRNKKWTDASYFKTEEMQTECERYTLLQQVLHNQWNRKLQNYLSRHGVVILSQNAQALHSGTMYLIAREK